MSITLQLQMAMLHRGKENVKAEKEGKNYSGKVCTRCRKLTEKTCGNSIKFKCPWNDIWRSLTSCFFCYRSNSKGYDLNRNFPDYFKQNTKRTQPETEAVKDWISKIQFLLSGSLHGGALVRIMLMMLRRRVGKKQSRWEFLWLSRRGHCVIFICFVHQKIA